VATIHALYNQDVGNVSYSFHTMKPTQISKPETQLLPRYHVMLHLNVIYHHEGVRKFTINEQFGVTGNSIVTSFPISVSQ